MSYSIVTKDSVYSAPTLADAWEVVVNLLDTTDEEVVSIVRNDYDL